LSSYNGQDGGKVGLYISAKPITKEKNYFEVEIIDTGVLGTIGWLYYYVALIGHGVFYICVLYCAIAINRTQTLNKLSSLIEAFCRL